MEKLVYVPGTFQCAKCKFSLMKTTLFVGSGTFASDSSPDTCPNCNVPMWRVTERDAGNELCDRLDALADDKMRIEKLPQCFHMLRTEPGAPGKDQQWWLTYAPNQKYGSAREAIDAYTAPGEKP